MTTVDVTTAAVLTEEIGSTLVIRLNRPEARNAVNLAMAGAIADAMEAFESRSDLVVAIIAANGASFCAGMDLKGFLAGERPSIAGRGFAGLVEAPPSKPLIAAVEGHAIAGGFEIVLACDMIVASESAVFGLPEVRRGLVAAGGGLMRLAGRIPRQHALEWALSGRLITAADADGLGLLNRYCATGTALETALDLADSIAANAPLAVAASKRIMVESPEWPSTEAFARQRAISEPVRASEDAIEGATAFREKRAPVWRGR